MISYGATHYVEWALCELSATVENRDPWIDINIAFELEGKQNLPEDLLHPSALVICNETGYIVQIVMLNEGCDSEYHFTETEKAQLISFVREHQLWKRAVKEL
jgi:hypothetical protein